MTVLWCSACKAFKGESEFYVERRRGTGRMARCKKCVNAYATSYRRKRRQEDPEYRTLERHYSRNRVTRPRRAGLSEERYQQLLDEQGGVCAVCKQPETTSNGRGGIRALAVDHDHNCCPGATTCGACVRGLLCAACNKALGFFNDDPELIRKAIRYIKENRQ